MWLARSAFFSEWTCRASAGRQGANLPFQVVYLGQESRLRTFEPSGKAPELVGLERQFEVER